MPSRILKESICTSEEIALISPEAEVLFYRLMVKADDFGLYHGNPKIIIGSCYPLKQPSEKKMIGWLKELNDAGLIGLYTDETDGKKYLKLLTCEKHQQKRASKSKFPLPQSFDINCNQVIADSLVNENENVNVNEKRDIHACAREVLAYLNEKANTNFEIEAESNVSLIADRMKENKDRSVDDFKHIHVISMKCAERLGDDGMRAYIRSKRLFTETNLGNNTKMLNNFNPDMELKNLVKVRIDDNLDDVIFAFDAIIYEKCGNG